MAKKGKKSKMVHISKLHKNHPYVKAVQTRTTAGFVVLAIILLGIIGVVIWGFVTNWGQGKANENYSCAQRLSERLSVAELRFSKLAGCRRMGSH